MARNFLASQATGNFSTTVFHAITDDVECIHLDQGRVQLKCDGTRWRTGEEVKGETGEWIEVASTLHTTSEHGVSSTADAHTSAASSRLNWRPNRFKCPRPFRRRTKCFLRVCHHISTCLYLPVTGTVDTVLNCQVLWKGTTCLTTVRLSTLNNEDSSIKLFPSIYTLT